MIPFGLDCWKKIVLCTFRKEKRSRVKKHSQLIRVLKAANISNLQWQLYTTHRHTDTMFVRRKTLFKNRLHFLLGEEWTNACTSEASVWLLDMKPFNNNAKPVSFQFHPASLLANTDNRIALFSVVSMFLTSTARKPFHFYNILLNDISIFFSTSFFLKSPVFFFISSFLKFFRPFVYIACFGDDCLVVNAEEEQQQWTMCVLYNSVWICLSFHMKCFASRFRCSSSVLFSSVLCR